MLLLHRHCPRVWRDAMEDSPKSRQGGCRGGRRGPGAAVRPMQVFHTQKVRVGGVEKKVGALSETTKTYGLDGGRKRERCSHVLFLRHL